MTTAKMDATRQALRDESAKTTSSFSLPGTRKHVAMCVTDQAVRSALLACQPRHPCNLSCCPVCARTRGRRYYLQSLKPAVAALTDPNQLRWITVNVCETDTLNSSDLTGSHHRALRHIVKTLRASYCTTLKGKPHDSQIRIWGVREVEPVMHADGTVRWKWHWHMIVHMDHLLDSEVGNALRKQWSEPHAVRIDPVRCATPKQLQRSLEKLASYPVKTRFTHANAAGQRSWLPAPVIDDLVRWMQARGSHWSRFTVGR